jgi:osmotically-inducible protein OsmY
MKRSLLIAFALALSVFFATPGVSAQSAPSTTDLTPAFLAGGVVIDGLRVTQVGDIVVIRGQAVDAAHAAAAATVARNLGYTRVANLVQLIRPADDAQIERSAERDLSLYRSLDGCHLSVNSEGGVVHLAGTVTHEMQKDVAIALVRRVHGVREVHSDLR